MNDSNLANQLEIMVIANIALKDDNKKLKDDNKNLIDTLQWIENKAHTHKIQGYENTDLKVAMELIEGNARIALDTLKLQF